MRPNAFLLVPGYGAQGAGAAALQGLAAGDASGFLVNASRSIIFAIADRRRRLSKGCGGGRRTYAQRPPGHPVTDETPEERAAAGQPPLADPDDPDAALRRLESPGVSGHAARAARPGSAAAGDPVVDPFIRRAAAPRERRQARAAGGARGPRPAPILPWRRASRRRWCSSSP